MCARRTPVHAERGYLEARIRVFRHALLQIPRSAGDRKPCSNFLCFVQISYASDFPLSLKFDCTEVVFARGIQRSDLWCAKTSSEAMIERPNDSTNVRFYRAC